MSERNVRRVVIVVFVGGIAGMIVGSIADNNGAAITFGLITAVAALGLILVTSVTVDAPGQRASTDRPAATTVDESAARSVEARVESLVAGGADEAVIRDLVRDAVRLGRSIAPGRPNE